MQDRPSMMRTLAEKYLDLANMASDLGERDRFIRYAVLYEDMAAKLEPRRKALEPVSRTL